MFISQLILIQSQIECQPSDVNVFDGLDLPTCSTEEEVDVFRNLLSNSLFPNTNCGECLSPCKYFKYKFRVTKYFVKNYNLTENVQVKDTVPLTNKTVLRINAEKFWVKGNSERLVFNFKDLLVNVGGFLGLFIGLSLNDVFGMLVDFLSSVSPKHVNNHFLV